MLGLPADLISQAATRAQDSPHYRLVAGHIAQLTADADALSADPAAALSGRTGIELIRGPLLSAGSDNGNSSVVPTADILLSRIRAYARRDLADPGLGAAQIAKAHNMSVRQLYKVCANAEYSLEQWIISQRLEQVARRSGAFTPPTDSRPGNGAGSRSPRTSRSGQPRSGVLACLPARASRPSIASSDSQSVAFCA
ncbi:hypothetical protein ACW9HR_09815 [Nocardia gipuzkoensis]